MDPEGLKVSLLDPQGLQAGVRRIGGFESKAGHVRWTRTDGFRAHTPRSVAASALGKCQEMWSAPRQTAPNVERSTRQAYANHPASR
jgi:hypothetical protein